MLERELARAESKGTTVREALARLHSAYLRDILTMLERLPARSLAPRPPGAGN